jgi:predicted PurR-regulated permease PerM
MMGRVGISDRDGSRGYRRGVADDGAPRAATSRVWRAGLTPESAALLVGAVLLAFFLRNVFVEAHRTVGWVVACAIVALLIDPLVDFVDRLLPRWLSVIVVLFAVLSVVAAVTVGLATDVLESLDDLKESAPEAAARLEEDYRWAADIGLTDRVQSFVDELDGRVRQEAVSQAAETAPTYLVTGILMLFLLAFGRRYFDGFVRQFDEERGEVIRDVVTAAALRGRAYLLVTLALAIVNGVIVGMVCSVLDLPAPASLGIAVGVFTILPLIGVLVGGVPALLLAFGLESWQTGVVVATTLLALQAFEAGVVRPRVDARTVRLGPTVPIIVGLLGFELYGIGGAIYGIALAVIVLAGSDAFGRLRGDDPQVAVSE